MNKIIFIFTFLIVKIGLGQNLVPNPSFEIYDTCPSSISSFGNYQINYANDWYSPSIATSDYFNSCSSTIGGANVPQAIFGYQDAFNGEAYIGLMILLDSGEVSYYEYAQAKLINQLQSGIKYEFSMYINLANGSDYSIQKFGAWFTSNQMSSNKYIPMFVTLPQVENSIGFINDTLGWQKISGEFIADGNEEYITLGFYCDTLNPDTIRFNNQASSQSIYSYVYIDELLLEISPTEVQIPNIFTPNQDNKNDIFIIKNAVGKTEMKIFNRWGELIYFGEGRNCYWDGRTYAGVECPEGVYYYSIIIEEKKYNGFIQVIR